MNLERFLVGKRRDSNPQGCGAEEARSVFQRSTQEAKRRSGTRPPTRRTRNPSVPAIKIERPEPITAQGAFLWASGGIRTRKGAELRKREGAPSPLGPRAPNIKKISAPFRKASRMQQPGNHMPRESGDTGLVYREFRTNRRPLNLDVLDVTARGALVWQGDVKQGGADLLVAPPKLNVRLPCQGPSQRQEGRRSVERRS